LFRLKSLTPTLSIDDQLPLRIKADRLKVTQILLNYISNAVKFTKPGSRLFIECRIVDGTIVIAVEEDSGPGVSTEDERMLFKRFVQLPRAQQRHEAGTGLGTFMRSVLILGLSICMQLAEMMHGRVWYEQRASLGSRFLFSLPLVPAANQESTNGVSLDDLTGSHHQEHAVVPVISPPPMPNLCPILVVEDNPCVLSQPSYSRVRINRKVLIKMLKQFKIDSQQIFIAEDGLEALDQCGTSLANNYN
jgi:CheY-like chemotaxis protein